jgi:hypothetical protein
MATRRKVVPESRPRRPPATTPEGRENQLITLAVDLTEQQLKDGTATSQVISHYLKLGSTRERLEQERLEHENKLLEAKIEAMASVKRIEELYETALNAMRSYAGHESLETFDD